MERAFHIFLLVCLAPVLGIRSLESQLPLLQTTGYTSDEATKYAIQNRKPTFRPRMQPPGTFQKLVFPSENPSKPKMVSSGFFDEIRNRATLEVEAKLKKQKKINEPAVCEIFEKVLDMARFLYRADGLGDSTAVLKLTEAVCPSLKRMYPLTTQDISCADILRRLHNYYNPKYVGLILKRAQMCDGRSNLYVNYAMETALLDVRAFFGVPFCPNSKCDKAGSSVVESKATTGPSNEEGGFESTVKEALGDLPSNAGSATGSVDRDDAGA